MHAIDQEERTPFIGRQAELARLETLLVRAIGGRSELVLVAGDAGVGKTRLTEELRYRAERAGASTLVGGCLDLEDGRLPLGPFIEALRPGLAVLSEGVRADLGAVAALTPYLSDAVNAVNVVLANSDPVLQQAAATGFTRIDVSLDRDTLDLKITLT